MVKPNIEVVLERIEHIKEVQAIEFDHIKKKLSSIEAYVQRINGDTQKNTKHRISQQTINKIMGAALVIILTGLVTLAIKILT